MTGNHVFFHRLICLQMGSSHISFKPTLAHKHGLSTGYHWLITFQLSGVENPFCEFVMIQCGFRGAFADHVQVYVFRTQLADSSTFFLQTITEAALDAQVSRNAGPPLSFLRKISSGGAATSLTPCNGPDILHDIRNVSVALAIRHRFWGSSLAGSALACAELSQILG